MARIIALLLLLSCSTDKGLLNSPPDTSQAIKELSEIQVAPQDIARRERIIRALQDCGSYSIDAYDKYIQSTKDISTCRSRITSLEKELEELEKEVESWRLLKRFFYLIVLVFIIYHGVKLYLKFKPI